MNSILRACRQVAIALCAIAILAGCSQDNRVADTGKCVEKADHEAPSSIRLSREEVHDAIGAMVEDCMKDLGYRHEMTDQNCIDDVDFNPACYEHRR